MAGKPAAPLKPHIKEKQNCLWNEIWKKNLFSSCCGQRMRVRACVRAC
jgi:hypothetical protein